MAQEPSADTTCGPFDTREMRTLPRTGLFLLFLRFLVTSGASCSLSLPINTPVKRYPGFVTGEVSVSFETFPRFGIIRRPAGGDRVVISKRRGNFLYSANPCFLRNELRKLRI